MSTETAAVVLAAAAGVLVVGLLVALRSLARAAAALAAAAEQLQRETVPLVIDLRAKVAETTGTVERMGLLIEAAESMTTTADSASRLAVAALGNPVVKSVAFGAGVARGFRRLTGRDAPQRRRPLMFKMFRRLLWLGSGFGLGVTAAVRLRRRVERTVERIRPGAVARVSRSRVVDAVGAGRAAMSQRELELRRAVDGRRRTERSRPGPRSFT